MAIYSNENSCFFERKIHKQPMTMPNAHYHDKHELYFLEEGKTKYFIENEIFTLEPGDMVFIPKFVIHKTDNGQNTNVIRLRFAFDDGTFSKEYQKYIDQLKQKRFIHIAPNNLNDLKSLISRLEAESEKKEDNFEEMQKLYFIQILILILRHSTSSVPLLSESERLVQAIATHISENLNHDLHLDALAKKYALSRGYLCRIFKSTTGISLGEYITISRISAAETLLRHTNKSITQISAECGFNDSNYFAAIFKKHKGITPKKFHLQEKNSK